MVERLEKSKCGVFACTFGITPTLISPPLEFEALLLVVAVSVAVAKGKKAKGGRPYKESLARATWSDDGRLVSCRMCSRLEI